MKKSNLNESVFKIGFWSGVLTVVFSIAYSIPQLVVLFTTITPPWDTIFIMSPSLLLSWAFLVLMVGIHYYAPQDKKIFSHIGIVFATLYAVFASIVYFTVLTVVVPTQLSGSFPFSTSNKVISFPGFQAQSVNVALLQYAPGSFMAVIDALAYFTLSMSTLFAASVFIGGRLERWTKWLFLANGIIGPFILLVPVIPSTIYVGSLWLVTFNLSAILATLVFHKQKSIAA